MTEDFNTENADALLPEATNDNNSPMHTVQASWAAYERPSVAVVEAIAVATDRDPLEIEPIYEYVEADALDTLILSDSGIDVFVSFQYEGYLVTVYGNGEISISVKGE